MRYPWCVFILRWSRFASAIAQSCYNKKYRNNNFGGEFWSKSIFISYRNKTPKKKLSISLKSSFKAFSSYDKVRHYVDIFLVVSFEEIQQKTIWPAHPLPLPQKTPLQHNNTITMCQYTQCGCRWCGITKGLAVGLREQARWKGSLIQRWSEKKRYR